MLFSVLFFFSSRRRHTRSLRDWSSDVCSSDLQWQARFLIGADGAASFARRRLIGIFPKRDLALAFGYNVATDETDAGAGSNGNNGAHRIGPATDEVVVRFPREFTGYLW